jgi:hypothetical protein
MQDCRPERVCSHQEASAVSGGTFATVTDVSERTISENTSAPRPLVHLVPVPAIPTFEPVTADPYTSTADALNEAVLQAQIGRLNPFDQGIVRRRLGLTNARQRTEHHAEALLLEERALGKLRHPSVLRPATHDLNRSLA